MNDKLQSVSKYVLSALLLILGIWFLSKYASGRGLEVQGKGMLFGSIMLIVIGVLSLPVVVNKIDKKIKMILTGLAVVGVVYGAWAVYNSLDVEIQYWEDKKAYDHGVIQGLKDIREAENAFVKVKGRYTDDIEGELTRFVDERVIPVPQTEGMFIEGQGEDENGEELGVGNGSEATYREKGFIIRYSDLDSIAEMLGTQPDALLKQIQDDQVNYKIRDTTYVALSEQKFSDDYRINKGLPPVDLSTWHLNPANEKFIVKTSTIDMEVGGSYIKQPTILVQDPTPFGRPNVKRDTLQFGSLDEAHTDGTWRRQE